MPFLELFTKIVKVYLNEYKANIDFIKLSYKNCYGLSQVQSLSIRKNTCIRTRIVMVYQKDMQINVQRCGGIRTKIVMVYPNSIRT